MTKYFLSVTKIFSWTHVTCGRGRGDPPGPRVDPPPFGEGFWDPPPGGGPGGSKTGGTERYGKPLSYQRLINSSNGGSGTLILAGLPPLFVTLWHHFLTPPGRKSDPRKVTLFLTLVEKFTQVVKFFRKFSKNFATSSKIFVGRRHDDEIF